MNRYLKVFEDLYKNTKSKFPNFKAGDTIEVKTKIKEGEKTRTQVFRGVVIQRKKNTVTGETFTVRKMVGDISVEKIFPIQSKIIDDIKVINTGIVRRARLFYLRKEDYKKKIKLKFVSKKNKEENNVTNTSFEKKINNNEANSNLDAKNKNKENQKVK